MYDATQPYNLPVNTTYPNWWWAYPQKSCDHCYCQEATPGLYENEITKDHLECCKCKDRLHKKFVSGGNLSDNTEKM